MLESCKHTLALGSRLSKCSRPNKCFFKRSQIIVKNALNKLTNTHDEFFVLFSGLFFTLVEQLLVFVLLLMVLKKQKVKKVKTKSERAKKIHRKVFGTCWFLFQFSNERRPVKIVIKFFCCVSVIFLLHVAS